MNDLKTLDFHVEATLCHIDGIFLHNFDDVYIRADSFHQLEYMGFAACYPLGEIAGLVVARYVFVKFPVLGSDHCARGDWT